MIDRFASRYTNPKTSHQYRAELTALFRHVRVTHPRLLSDGAVNQWVALDRVDPALHVTSRGSGSCYRFGGGAAGRYYYRCGTDQPCFAGPQGTATPLVCPFLGNPTTDQVILWTATSVDTSAPPATVKTPFAMKLSNGTVCVFVSAAWGGLGPFDCQAAMANASAVPADCHEPVEGSPYWTVECQNAKTDSSPFSSATVLMVWF